MGGKADRTYEAHQIYLAAGSTVILHASTSR